MEAHWFTSKDKIQSINLSLEDFPPQGEGCAVSLSQLFLWTEKIKTFLKRRSSKIFVKDFPFSKRHSLNRLCKQISGDKQPTSFPLTIYKNVSTRCKKSWVQSFVWQKVARGEGIKGWRGDSSHQLKQYNQQTQALSFSSWQIINNGAHFGASAWLFSMFQPWNTNWISLQNLTHSSWKHQE